MGRVRRTPRRKLRRPGPSRAIRRAAARAEHVIRGLARPSPDGRDEHIRAILEWSLTAARPAKAPRTGREPPFCAVRASERGTRRAADAPRATALHRGTGEFCRAAGSALKWLQIAGRAAPRSPAWRQPGRSTRRRRRCRPRRARRRRRRVDDGVDGVGQGRRSAAGCRGRGQQRGVGRGVDERRIHAVRIVDGPAVVATHLRTSPRRTTMTGATDIDLRKRSPDPQPELILAPADRGRRRRLSSAPRIGARLRRVAADRGRRRAMASIRAPRADGPSASACAELGCRNPPLTEG
jgi:hypothetical protein